MARTFLDWIRQIWNNSGKILNRTSKTSSKVFYNYETISLRLYLLIVETEEYEKICISGNASREECVIEWEKIVSKNYETNGEFDYVNYIDLQEGFAHLLNEYNVVKAQLLKLSFVVDENIIEELRGKGYRIDTSSKSKYIESLNSALHRSDNIISRIKIKKSEINSLIEDERTDDKPTFDSIVALVSMYLGFPIPDDIGLARFNEYKKLIKKKVNNKAA